jgi:hypothetical protein
MWRSVASVGRRVVAAAGAGIGAGVLIHSSHPLTHAEGTPLPSSSWLSLDWFYRPSLNVQHLDWRTLRSNRSRALINDGDMIELSTLINKLIDLDYW